MGCVLLLLLFMCFLFDTKLIDARDPVHSIQAAGLPLGVLGSDSVQVPPQLTEQSPESTATFILNYKNV